MVEQSPIFGAVTFSLLVAVFTGYLSTYKLSTVRGKEVVLAIDIGSSSIRCSSFSIEDEVEKTATHLCYHGDCSDKVEFQLGFDTTPEVVFLRVDEMVSECASRLRAAGAKRVVGIGFASFAMNLVGFNNAGECVTPLYTYMGTGSSGCDGAEDSLFHNVFPCSPSFGARDPDSSMPRQEFMADLLAHHHYFTGTMYHHSSYLLAQLYYSNRRSTPVAARSTDPAYYQTLSSYVMSRWCSRSNDTGVGVSAFPVSYSEASWTGLLNFRDMRWDTSSIDLINDFNSKNGLLGSGSGESRRSGHISLPISSLPPLCDPEDLTGPDYTLSPRCIRKWSGSSDGLFSVDTKLFLGIGDGAAANWGSSSGDGSGIEQHQAHPLVVTIGTSAATRAIVDRDLVCGAVPGGGERDKQHKQEEGVHIAPGLFCYVLNRRHLLIGGALTDGGSLVEWCRTELLGGDQGRFRQYMAELLAEATPVPTVPAAAHRSGGTVAVTLSRRGQVPVMLPFWTTGAGERAPGYHSQAVGTISHMSKSTTVKHLLQCAVEGVSFRLVEIVSLLRSVTSQCEGGTESILVASGGALDASPYWRKLLAVLTGSSSAQQ